MIDSAADIGMEEAKNLGITMVPMNIMIGDEEYYDGVNLSPTDFFEKLIGSEVLPKTSLVNSFRWEEEIQNVLGEDDELILITISSKLSGTYKSACDAAEKFNGAQAAGNHIIHHLQHIFFITQVRMLGSVADNIGAEIILRAVINPDFQI